MAAVCIVNEVRAGVSAEVCKKDDDYSSQEADRISADKLPEVESSCCYWNNCIHFADDDMSSSFTDGVYIEES